MSENNRILTTVVSIDEDRIRDHLGELISGTVEENQNTMLDTDPYQQPAGTDHVGGLETDTDCGSVFGRQLGANTLLSQAEAHCRNEVGNAEISPDG